MPKLSYQVKGLVLQRESGPASSSGSRVADLQADLRALGYLRAGIDGVFGPATALAVNSLRYDLLHNAGNSRGDDGPAPVAVLDFNKGRVSLVNGILDQGLAACIADMLAAEEFPKLPSAADPKAENARVREALRGLAGTRVPVPFLMAAFMQESGLRHFNEPSPGDRDNYIVLGLDTNAGEKHIVTSRGYGVGQYTLFHHPPRRDEVAGVMREVAGNIRRAEALLREKFDDFIVGPTSGRRADDRIAEHGSGPLRACRYRPGDAGYLRDCAGCARAAGCRDIKTGDPAFRGSSITFQPTRYYKANRYRQVPVRANFPCDWPYAVRRYNGAGVDSYHYQAIVLRNLLAVDRPDGG